MVGSANVDLTTFSDRFPKAGETIFGDHFDLGWGGKGANQAVAARLCGAEVTMVARVGEDLFGPATVENFRAQGIDASHVRVVKGASSGVAPIFVESNGQNRIIVVKGANDRLLPADVDEAHAVLEAADCIVLQFEIPLETVPHGALRPAAGHPLHRESCAWSASGPCGARRRRLLRSERNRGGDDYRNPGALDRRCQGLCRAPRRAGSSARDHHPWRKWRVTGAGGGAELFGPYRVATKDTTGAGDAFVGSFAVFLGEGLSEREALARANLYAALSTTGVGTQKSFATRERFEDEWRRRS